jgi:hypothetical protein
MRKVARAISGPLATVNGGQQRSPPVMPTPRSAPVTAENPTLPKLVVRVRFPSPAQCWPGGTPGTPDVRGSAPPRVEVAGLLRVHSEWRCSGSPSGRWRILATVPRGVLMPVGHPLSARREVSLEDLEPSPAVTGGARGSRMSHDLRMTVVRLPRRAPAKTPRSPAASRRTGVLPV